MIKINWYPYNMWWIIDDIGYILLDDDDNYYEVHTHNRLNDLELRVWNHKWVTKR